MHHRRQQVKGKLRRAQALAPYNPVGVQVARYLLTGKLQEQQELLDRLPGADGYSRRILADGLSTVQAAATVEQAVTAEAAAAAAYWRSWAPLEIRFRPADRRRIPEQWQQFGTRQSPIGGGPRMAVTPGNAILNYLYSLLEAETRLACFQLGLDPALAVIHADIRGRDSLPLDLMEPVRPHVDRYLYALLTDRVFAAADFHETRRGSCRLLPPLTHQLAETLPAWRQLVAPVAEQVARLFLQHTGDPGGRPTPLTQTNRRADRARRHQRPLQQPVAVRPPKPERRCKRCGGELPHRDRVYCDGCLPFAERDRYQALAAMGRARRSAITATGSDPSHGGRAAARRSMSQIRRNAELREWQASGGDQPTDPEWFRCEVLPYLDDVSLTVLARATGLSTGYVSQIRRGFRTPHPRHWLKLAAAANVARRPLCDRRHKPS